MKNEPPSLYKLEIAKNLVRKAFAYAEIAHEEKNKLYSQLAQVILEQAEVRISAKSIRELYNFPASEFVEDNFALTKSKEVLAAFVLLKEGHIQDKHHIKIKLDTTSRQRTIEHNIYFEKYCRLNSTINLKEGSDRSNIPDDFSLIENKIPDYLINSTWRMYNSDNDGNIYGHILKINQEQYKNLTACELINADKDYQDYEGWVGMDGTLGYLIFNVVNKKVRQKYLQMMWKLPMGSNPNITMGIVTYISSSKNRLSASIILLERMSLDMNAQTIVESEDTHVPEEVKRLFSLSKMRLLVLPDRAAINFEELRKWIDTEEKALKDRLILDEILLSYCQEYWIYYMYEDDYAKKIIDKVDFQIYFSSISSQIRGNLIISDKEKYDDGIVTRNGSFISAYFSKQFLSGANTRTSYLVFKIGEEYIASKMECFVGIVSGLAEDHESAVSYLALIVPKTFREIDHAWLIEFFSSKNWKIETYAPKGFKFDNL